MKKIFAIINIVFFILTLPFIGVMLLFGLAGSDSFNVLISTIGYLGIFFTACLSIWKHKYLKLIFICYLLMGLGLYLDLRFWKKHNLELCKQIKSDKFCKEDELGYSCNEPSKLGNFSTTKGICKDYQ